MQLVDVSLEEKREYWQYSKIQNLWIRKIRIFLI